MKSGERYHPGFDEWQPISSLIARRSGPAIVTKEQRQIYAIGGHDGRIVRKSVEIYDITRDRWHRVADMHIARRNAVAEAAYRQVRENIFRFSVVLRFFQNFRILPSTHYIPGVNPFNHL